jgi:hypothetical protein
MPRRLVALLLLSVFLGAGTTLPGPDALLHHWSGQSQDLRSHVEPAGGCASHTEQCTLGRTATGAQVALAQGPVFRIEPAGRAPSRPTPVVRIIAADRGAIPQPRAPPAPAA